MFWKNKKIEKQNEEIIGLLRCLNDNLARIASTVKGDPQYRGHYLSTGNWSDR